MNTDGTPLDPEARWGGIQRALTTTDFEASNIEFIQFWLMDPFNEEFETLLRTVATNIKLKYEHPSFVKCELMNNYRIVDEIINLPDIAQDSKVWALFKLNIKHEDIQNQSIEVLRCYLSYMDINSEIKNKGPVKIKLDPVNQNAFEMMRQGVTHATDFDSLKANILTALASV